MFVATYGRVSTSGQENEETIENQFMAIKEFADKKELIIVKQYKDEGWSGTILARPALDELRIDAKNKKWEAVVIYDPDRLARKYSYQELLIDELQEAGIQVLFVTTPPVKDDSDRLLMGVKGIFAEYERAKITERFRLGKLRKAHDGKLVTGNAPYGYQYIPRQAKRDGKYKIIPAEAEVVRMIFNWVGEEGLTMRSVVKRLLAMGIPPRKSKRKVWNTSTLVNLLRNETYIGTAYFNKSLAIVPINPLKHEKYKKYKKTSRVMKAREDWVPITVPALIDKKLFEKVKVQLKMNYDLTTRNKKNEYLLAGIIYCMCGRKRTGEGPMQGKHLYYRCTDRIYSHPLPPKCRERGTNARVSDILVWKGVSELMSSPQLLNRQIQQWIGKKQAKAAVAEDSVEKLELEIEKLKTEEARYVKAFGAQIIDSEQLEEAMTDLRTRRGILERQVGVTKSQKKTTDEFLVPSDKQIEQFSQKAKLVLNDLSFDSKQAIIRKVVDTIIATQKQVRVRGYLPIQQKGNVEYGSESRNSWASERWKIYIIQCTFKKEGGSFC